MTWSSTPESPEMRWASSKTASEGSAIMFTWRWPIFSGRCAPIAVTLAMEEARNCLRFIDVIDDMAGESEHQPSAPWTDVSRLLFPRHCAVGVGDKRLQHMHSH